MNAIVLVIPSLTMGGAERVVVTLANGLSKRNWEVFLASPSASGALRDDLSSAVAVVDFATGRVGRAIVPLARFLAKHPDALVFSAMTHMNVATLLAARVLRRHAGPVCVQEVSLFSRGRESEPPVRGRLSRFLMRFLYRRADAVFSISQAVAQEVGAILGNKRSSVFTIPNPADLVMVRRGADGAAPHPWLAELEGSESAVLLGVGRLAPEKGFDVLLRAVARLRRDGGTHRLLLVGDGGERGRLELLAANLGLDDASIQFVGAQSNPWSYMARASALVVPSHAEGFGLVVAEAMACGTQVVSTRCGAPEEILEHGRLGEMAAVDDPEALAAAIARALASPRDPADLKAAAAQYDADTVIDLYAARLASIDETFRASRVAYSDRLTNQSLQ